MFYAYALYCLISNLAVCQAVDVGQVAKAACQSSIQATASGWLASNTGYQLTKTVCLDMPTDLGTIATLYHG